MAVLAPLISKYWIDLRLASILRSLPTFMAQTQFTVEKFFNYFALNNSVEKSVHACTYTFRKSWQPVFKSLDSI